MLPLRSQNQSQVSKRTRVTLVMRACTIARLMDLQQLSKRASRGVKSGLAEVHLIACPCTYYHYLCDDIDDRVLPIGGREGEGGFKCKGV